MKFTDEDLKRLKECIDPRTQRLDIGLFKKIDISIDGRIPLDETTCVKVDLTALLYRLECAEACIDDHRGDCLADIGKKCSCGYQELLNAWLQSKGEK